MTVPANVLGPPLTGSIDERVREDHVVGRPSNLEAILELLWSIGGFNQRACDDIDLDGSRLPGSVRTPLGPRAEWIYCERSILRWVADYPSLGRIW